MKRRPPYSIHDFPSENFTLETKQKLSCLLDKTMAALYITYEFLYYRTKQNFF